jgi:hypothetical protein
VHPHWAGALKWKPQVEYREAMERAMERDQHPTTALTDVAAHQSRRAKAEGPDPQPEVWRHRKRELTPAVGAA